MSKATADKRIYLASRSPRRRELLTQIGVRFDPMLFRADARLDPEADETPLPGEDPLVYVQRVAIAKAALGLALVKRRQLLNQPVLAADTTLDLDGEILGKPASKADAAAMLARLSGRTHKVLTAIVVAQDERVRCLVSRSDVVFRDLDLEEIARYVASGEPMDKAGSYGLQGFAATFVTSVSGSPSGIVGLPLFETAALLREFGVLS